MAVLCALAFAAAYGDSVPEVPGSVRDDAWRTAHAILMLASDATFAATASMGRSARFAQSDRDRHRTWAFGSASLALVSYVMMLSPTCRD